MFAIYHIFINYANKCELFAYFSSNRVFRYLIKMRLKPSGSYKCESNNKISCK